MRRHGPWRRHAPILKAALLFFFVWFTRTPFLENGYGSPVPAGLFFGFGYKLADHEWRVACLMAVGIYCLIFLRLPWRRAI